MERQPPRSITICRNDPLKHFSKDKPAVKLAALLIVRGSYVLTSGLALFVIGTARAWW